MKVYSSDSKISTAEHSQQRSSKEINSWKSVAILLKMANVLKKKYKNQHLSL